jgi:large subunit ribosomal protein L3
MLSGLLGKKLGMTQVFGPQGAAIPVTVIEAGPCTVTQIKKKDGPDGYEAAQIGFGRAKHATRPELGHLGHTLAQLPAQRRKQQQAQAKARAEARAKAAEARAESKDQEAEEGAEEAEEEAEAEATEEATLEAQAEEAEARGQAESKPSEAIAQARTAQRDPQRKRPGGGLGPFEVLREVRPFGSGDLQVGQQFDTTMFKIGELVDVVGTSKGKGFQGVMKRHGFRGGPRTHGQSDRPRAPGSIGAGNTPGRVLKGTRMAGHMGASRVTVKRLEVIATDAERNLLLVKGSIPGPTGGMLMIRKVPTSIALAERLEQQAK